MSPGTASLRCVSWNIAGKYKLLQLQQLQQYLENFDIICFTETHRTQKGDVDFKNFKVYEFPDSQCNQEYPRGGACLLVKHQVKKFVKHVKLLMTDFIEIVFTNGSKLINLYIPPTDSVYYDEQYIELLCSLFIEADEEHTPIASMGDLNSRLGDLNDLDGNYTYANNVDSRVNENGRHLKQVLFSSSSALPLNNLNTTEQKFGGGFTFKRNEKKSQIDWCFVNDCMLPSIETFQVDTQCPLISDHYPIVTGMNICGDRSADLLIKAAIDLNHSTANHSKVPLISAENTNLSLLTNLMKIEGDKVTPENMTSNEIADFLYTNIHRFGKICKTPKPSSTVPNNIMDNSTVSSFHQLYQRKEEAKWKFVLESTDSKNLWNSINMKGEIKGNPETHLDVNELAEIHSNKSKIDPTQVYLKDITTDTTNAELDKDITETEIGEAVEKLKKSKTSDGIGVSTVKSILPVIMSMLVIFYNLIFKGGKEAYPSVWMNFVNAIAKKGRLLPPKFVRFITVMGMFEKIYQIILSSRLYSFLKVPFQQTAYQTGKGCNLHVMTIRLLKVLTKKTKQKLVIVFTDFEAAFDLVSRRLLFQKLVRIGVSAGMLTALIAIYEAGKSVVEHRGEYSDYLVLLAGVKQGAPPSGLLYIAYTMGLIDVYELRFKPEPLIGLLHLLMHADDILMLSTCHNTALEKVKCLIQYCKDNYIRLQITKCAIMCVNGSKEDEMVSLNIDDLVLGSTVCEVYLGSAITNSNKLSDDVNADIKLRQVGVVKYFAFLRNNVHAPVPVKLKVLDVCLLMSLLYNSETWADSKFQKLETVYRRMLKSILGVGMTTCTELLYIELGVLSLQTRVLVKQWSFWKKVLEMGRENPIIQVIELARHYNLKEVRHYDNLLEMYSSAEEIVSNFFDKIRTAIRQKAENGRSKYATYLEINPNLETPAIYNNLYDRNQVSMVAKLRLSSHNLNVEMGRRTGLSREERLCHCGDEVETEKHFLLECGLYHEIRERYNVINELSISKVLNDINYINYIKECINKRKTLT